MSTVNKYMMNTGQVWGRVRLNNNAPVYKNKWVELINIDSRIVTVFIWPVEREFTHNEIDKLELSTAPPHPNPQFASRRLIEV